MRLVLTTDEFLYAGVPIERFPMLLSDQGDIVRPVFRFLTAHLLESGNVQSVKTWETYGYFFLDYFRFLERNKLDWDAPKLPGTLSVVANYRRAMLRDGEAKATLNPRLRLICKFYEFALTQGLIAELPFDYDRTWSQPEGGWVGPPTRELGSAPKVRLRVPVPRIKVLTGEQSVALLNALENPQHRLMGMLSLATGIRVEELCTFPLARIKNPIEHPGVRHIFPVELNPREMSTKGSVFRSIHVPRGVMQELWAYSAMTRGLRANSASPGVLFLNRYGDRFTRNGFWMLLKRAGAKAGIDVSPHILRHSYATHTLHALKETRNTGNALLYVKERLGHASIKTTERYLHYVDDVADDALNAWQTELVAYLC
ncbi:MAG TPA: tyrosine-type recombinase/integrase [Dyella sp.]|nr:tyrosine-type recombinase/integrase [Dyella sp.]